MLSRPKHLSFSITSNQSCWQEETSRINANGDLGRKQGSRGARSVAFLHSSVGIEILCTVASTSSRERTNPGGSGLSADDSFENPPHLSSQPKDMEEKKRRCVRGSECQGVPLHTVLALRRERRVARHHLSAHVSKARGTLT